MAWCEANTVDYVFGLARNLRLEKRIAAALNEACRLAQISGETTRVFRDFLWSTKDSWSRRRRVIAKAEWMPARSDGGANPLSSSPRSSPSAGRPGRSMRTSTAPAETWRTASRNVNSTLMPTVPAPGPCVPTNCACGSFLRLCAHVRRAPHRARPYTPRRRHLRQHPPQALEDRRSGARLGASHQDRHGLRVSLPRRSGRPRPCPNTRRGPLSRRGYRIFSLIMQTYNRIKTNRKPPRRRSMVR